MNRLKNFIHYISHIKVITIKKKIWHNITSFSHSTKKGSPHIRISETQKAPTALKDLAPGEEGVVKSLSLNENMGLRLKDLGLVEGTVVRCLGKSPLGDPMAFLLRGAVIALRVSDCENVLLVQQKR